MIDYHRLKATDLGCCEQTYTAPQCILYALGVGAGLAAEQGFGDETHFLYEEGLQAVPTMAHVLAYPGFWMREPEHGIDWRMVVHGEQRMRLLGPIPVAGRVCSRSRISAVSDRGQQTGAVVVVERHLFEAETGRLLAMIEQVNVCRGDGGYARGDPALSDAGLAPIPRPPARAPDHVRYLPTARNQAAIYRLNGDLNPLHVDRQSARAAGFAAPILHGLSLAGIACRAILLDAPASELAQFNIRFSAPVYPGETVVVETWEEGGLAFRCSDALGARVLAFGSAAFGAMATTHV
ncbi:MaoC family dehydratase N-terminal domain-containing protein [Aquabacter sp. L1I39]|uniref:MaoC/PaaZ C-terminal domain-containing protein n=1 Tax=Aquabacter sp. L1I39 TaxID=2820278 RepID=UPI001ADA4288|nr:MaoC/PaaZ C-terminal domain-containing protein [Aquabacter sp. L1I39]QTL04803.1 MaoC family dehydratase N-terminal domain-containing protein [Aquabacter sp. L1I39]